MEFSGLDTEWNLVQLTLRSSFVLKSFLEIFVGNIFNNSFLQ